MNLTNEENRRILWKWAIGGTVALVTLLGIEQARSETLLAHPRGCPAVRFCGCGAAVEIFGKPVRSLWLARNWFRFPRTSAAPGMVAVRKSHVFVLRRHVQGNVWITHDYNSGGHKSRQHQRSIAGFSIVNPYAVNVAGM